MAALTRAQREQIKSGLTERRRTLLGRIREELLKSGEQHFVDLAGRVHDTGDESVASLLADVDAARAHHDFEEFRATEAALARVDEQSFGQCDDCGTDIAFGRLMAYPTANRCITCQTRHESQYAHAGTPRL
ncbi:MAG: TraR/DksA family transcriptional regulator [Burkholderiales bacterium]